MEGAEFAELIAEVRERTPPAIYQRYKADVDQAMQCLGPVRAGIDYEVLQEGKYAASSIRGQAFNNSWVNRSITHGLHNNIPNLNETDFRRDWASLFGVIFSWMNSDGRWISGTLSGARQTTSLRTFDTRCDQPMLPAERGRIVNITFKTDNHNATTGTSSVDSATRLVSETNMKMHFLEGPFSAETALQRYGFLRLAGASAAKWQIYEVRVERHNRYITLEVDPAARQYYKDTSTNNLHIFIEGPNLLYQVDGWDETLLPGWTLTVREVSG